MIDVFQGLRMAADSPYAQLRELADAAPRPSPIPPPPRKSDGPDLALIAAVLAAGLIAASGREHTAEEAVGVWRVMVGVLRAPEAG